MLRCGYTELWGKNPEDLAPDAGRVHPERTLMYIGVSIYAKGTYGGAAVAAAAGICSGVRHP